MNIIASQRNITEYALKLSEADAREAVESPYVFADRLAEQLRAAGVTPGASSNGQPHRKPKLSQQLVIGNGRTSRKAKAARPNGRAGASHKSKHLTAGGLNRVSCPDCGQELAAKYLPLHRLKKHQVPAESQASASVA